MIIISHRGYWLTPEEKNKEIAFNRSFSLGFGTETDVRDHAGELVISHDMPLGHEMKLNDFLTLLKDNPLPLALNIKADGLAEKVHDTMKAYDRNNWFVFDMSIPDTRMQLKYGNPVFSRISEIEPEPACIEQAVGIWLDAFTEDAWRLNHIEPWLTKGKQVCLVSPELHGRDHKTFWHALRQTSYLTHPGLTLCTDLPEDAKKFFNGTI